MSISLICKDQTTGLASVFNYPKKYEEFSNFIMTAQSCENQEDGYGSGSDSEENDTENLVININGLPETCKDIITLLEMNNDKEKKPVPKKASDAKFDINKELGENTVEFMKSAGKERIYAITNLANFLQINLVAHICFTWLAHQLNTLDIDETMDYFEVQGKKPTFEEILHMKFEDFEEKVPAIPVANLGASK